MPARPSLPSAVPRPSASAAFSEPAARSTPVRIWRTMLAISMPTPSTTRAPNTFGTKPISRVIIALTGTSRPCSSSAPKSAGRASSHTSALATPASVATRPGLCSLSSMPALAPPFNAAARTSRAPSQATTRIDKAPKTRGTNGPSALVVASSRRVSVSMAIPKDVRGRLDGQSNTQVGERQPFSRCPEAACAPAPWWWRPGSCASGARGTRPPCAG